MVDILSKIGMMIDKPTPPNSEFEPDIRSDKDKIGEYILSQVVCSIFRNKDT